MPKKLTFSSECRLYSLIHRIRDTKDEEENKTLSKEEAILSALNRSSPSKYRLIWKDNVRGISNKTSLHFPCSILFLIISTPMSFIVPVPCTLSPMASILLSEKDRDLRSSPFTGITSNSRTEAVAPLFNDGSSTSYFPSIKISKESIHILEYSPGLKELSADPKGSTGKSFFLGFSPWASRATPSNRGEAISTLRWATLHVLAADNRNVSTEVTSLHSLIPLSFKYRSLQFSVLYFILTSISARFFLSI